MNCDKRCTVKVLSYVLSIWKRSYENLAKRADMGDESPVAHGWSEVSRETEEKAGGRV